MLQVKVEGGKVYVTINKPVSTSALCRWNELSSFKLSFQSVSEADQAGEGDVQQSTRRQTHHHADRRRSEWNITAVIFSSNSTRIPWKVNRNVWIQVLLPSSVLKHCGRTATKVESSWWRETTCLRLTSPNWVRWGVSQRGEGTSCPLPDFRKDPASFQALNLDSSSILLRSADFYQQYGIEVWTKKEVRSTKEHWQCIKSRSSLRFTNMFWVVGGVGELSRQGGEVERWHLAAVWPAPRLNRLQVQIFLFVHYTFFM